MGKKKKKKKQDSRAVRTSKKPVSQKSGFDYFCELWDRFKTTSRSSSV